LPEAFAARGVDARWVCWDDPDVDWAAADLVAVRSTWDYDGRLTRTRFPLTRRRWRRRAC